MAGWIDSKIFSQLENALDVTSLRNKVLANNIANIDTPNFKRSDVNFQAVLGELMEKDQGLALKRTSPKHLTGNQFSGPLLVQDHSTSYRNDDNNVDIDLEMTRLAENTLQYNALARIYSSHLNLLRQVVRE
ncbi:MAG: flagellar basal body rod protein FlgB [Bacillota bacterium]|jgi:flagellar basal-body rod protein FlgB